MTNVLKCLLYDIQILCGKEINKNTRGNEIYEHRVKSVAAISSECNICRYFKKKSEDKAESCYCMTTDQKPGRIMYSAYRYLIIIMITESDWTRSKCR
jgi:hypothetical protein